MKIVLTQAICPEGMAALRAAAELDIADSPDPAAYLDRMQDADGLVIRLGKCGREVIDNSPRLRVIARTGIGYDTVDVAAATARGIPVVVTPGANVHSVAEHALALIMALSKNLLEAHTEMCRDNWEIRNAGKAFELAGKLVGIIGMGPIGRDTAKLCMAVGMRAAVYDPFFTREEIEAQGAIWYETLDGLLRDSDIVSIHMPLVDATRDLITRRELALMKKTALLINCSRGGIVREEDLAQALREGMLAGAGIDVFTKEPPPADHPLRNCPNILLSPHAAAQTREAVVKMGEMCSAGCLAVLEGKKWPHVVDPKVYDHPRWQGKGPLAAEGGQG